MTTRAQTVWLLNQAPLLLFLIVLLTLGCLSERFLHSQNLINILIQSSSLAVAAIGMTMVLLTAGVDLSVGSLMFVSVAIAGKLVFNDWSMWLGFTAAILVGAFLGALNSLFVVHFRITSFIATLAMLFIARGFGLWLTNTRAMNMPESVTALGSSAWYGIPIPILVMLAMAFASHWFLQWTTWGRQIYAIGFDIQAARKSGIRVKTILVLVYGFCGLCAAVSGLIALTQTGAVSPSFGQNREFAAIAAAVLGGTSLFGGRGSILPGTLLGAILFQMIDNGLVVINADPYLYPMVLSGIIFIAVLLDTTRHRMVTALTQRKIRVVREN